MIRSYIKLIRPKHWLKNVLIFFPLLYSGYLTQSNMLIASIQCFIAFCLVSSAVYVINDIADAPKDRLHPEKCKRPIAAGQIGIRAAVALAVFLGLIGLALSAFGYGNYYVLLCAVLYVLLNLLYSFFLKNLVVIDCFCIATGFLLRVYAGGAAGNIHISEWLFLTILAISLFMAFGKRRGEMLTNVNGVTRVALVGYDMGFINGIVFSCAGMAVIFYALWAMAETSLMIYTVPLVIFIVCKYLLNVYGAVSSGDPVTTILGDKGLMVSVLLFALVSAVLLYV